MFAPWRSQKSLRKHKDPITGNSFNRQHAQLTLLTDSEYISSIYLTPTRGSSIGAEVGRLEFPEKNLEIPSRSIDQLHCEVSGYSKQFTKR